MKNLMCRAYADLFQLRHAARDLLANKSGATMIEYSVLIALITILLIVTIGNVGDLILTNWQTLETNLTPAAP